MKHFACFVLTLLAWLLLTWSVDPQEVMTGLILAALVSIVFHKIYPQHPERLLNPARWFWFALYVPYFFYYCLKANLDVAYRVIHPDVPIRPGIVKVTTALQSEMGKLFLANSITLTPGTLSVDIDGQDLYIHWINVASDDPDEQTEMIVKRFERFLARIFG